MRVRVWATGLSLVLALGLAGFFLFTGSSQKKPCSRASAVMEQEADERPESVSTGAATQSVERTPKSMQESFAEVPAPGARKASEDGVHDAEISVRVSGRAERDAYELARARATDPLGTASDR